MMDVVRENFLLPGGAESGRSGESLTPGRTVYMPISCTWLLVLSILSLGLFQFYWFYRNWCYVDRDSPGISPFLRALYSVFWVFPLLERIARSAQLRELPLPWHPLPLAILWILLTQVPRLSFDLWFTPLLAPLVLLPVQATVNAINRLEASAAS